MRRGAEGRSGGHRRRPRPAAGGGPVPAVGGSAGRAGRARRLGQPDLPPRLGAVAAAAERRLVRAAGRQGADVAAASGGAPATGDPAARRARRAGRGLSVSVVGVPVARGSAGVVGPDPRSGGAATALASFLVALQRAPAAGGPAPGRHNFFRGGPLATYAEETSRALEA